ncbi:hypothetical protein Ade02nite_89180 [Paractinoplanes deccanensis]|uniref:SnoaL-like domain-containing protein n=1 Tax=Paractinoplanes deccanensis TaxID=113561 RepID=A0ABQ3YJV9_9ACTN|nr:nuclear transport factor 2 family protein [Actinoplanes deccanensis]GID80277.1 hypothetical protein Ade02nite_89180 [Actinoplanes deccanensis]
MQVARQSQSWRRLGGVSSTQSAWLAAVRAALVPLAGMRVEIGHVLADGAHVVVHTRRRLPGAGPEIEVVDIWCVEDGLIAEGGELIEPVAQATANLAWWEGERPEPGSAMIRR